MINKIINKTNEECIKKLNDNCKKILDRYNLTLEDIKDSKEYKFEIEETIETYKVSKIYKFIKNDEILAMFREEIITDLENYNVTTKITDVYFIE